MNHQQYIEQNALGFEGDMIAKNKFQKLIQDNHIKTVIETGTFRGATTKHFATWVNTVHTIEVNKDNFIAAHENLKEHKNVILHLGSSESVLDEIFESMSKDELIFIFLDAHWESYNPLLDELAVIAKHGFKPIIVIHDFKVPGHPELGFDVYKDIVYEWEWIKDSIYKIYGNMPWLHEYNYEATGAKRGIIYIYPESIEL